MFCSYINDNLIGSTDAGMSKPEMGPNMHTHTHDCAEINTIANWTPPVCVCVCTFMCVWEREKESWVKGHDWSQSGVSHMDWISRCRGRRWRGQGLSSLSQSQVSMELWRERRLDGISGTQRALSPLYDPRFNPPPPIMTWPLYGVCCCRHFSVSSENFVLSFDRHFTQENTPRRNRVRHFLWSVPRVDLCSEDIFQGKETGDA